MKPDWRHRHPPELHAIGLGLCEELTTRMPGCTFRFNAGDCEVTVFKDGRQVAILDLDDEIEVWTVGTPCGVAGRVDYASPNFLNETTDILNLMFKFQSRQQPPVPK